MSNWTLLICCSTVSFPVFLSLCLIHKYSRQILWNTGCASSVFYKLEFVFVYMQHWKKTIFESCVCNHAISIMVLFIQIKTRTESTLSAWWGLFAVCLYSNIYFMQSCTDTLCVVHFGPDCWTNSHSGGVVVFLTSSFNTGQYCL